MSVKPVVLTVAGSDPSGGAGVQQDLRTFAALGVWGVSAITAITVQTATRVDDVVPLDASLVAAQIRAAVSDAPPAAAKTGMLATAAVVEAVAAALRDAAVPNLVVDPVLVSTSGRPLLDPAGVGALVRDLLPLATLVTPNAPEAEALAGFPVSSLADQRKAAATIRALGARAVLVTGGHIPGDESIDVLDDGETQLLIRVPRSSGDGLHGTGCALSAAIAALIGSGRLLPDAVRAASGAVHEAIMRGSTTNGPGYIDLR